MSCLAYLGQVTSITYSTVLFLPAQQSWPSLGRCFLLLTAFTVGSLTLLRTSLNCQGMDGVGLAVLSFLRLLFTVGVLRGILTP